MNKKVMDALEAVADEANFQKPVDGQVEVDKANLDILIAWAMGQRIHLQYGEEVGLKVYEEDEEGFDPEDLQPRTGKIIGFSGENGVLVETEHYPTMYYERADVRTL
jgi:hypothetical protein